ncbi:prephenate dehydratase [Sulfolobus acidocaldarius SUSAZ]|nr:prephenate dehydratase [Sulfolobus acidocaldarius SUSAZ]
MGVVPIENSKEGPVHESLDNLFRYENIYVNYEVEKNINLVIASNQAINSIKDVKKVYSHPHAIQEAKEKLEELGLHNIIPVESTSIAAKYASEDKYAAAICSRYAAQINNLNILLENVENGVNLTRFVIISNRFKISGEKTMIFFTIPHKPGSLYKVLERFYVNNINLTMIYSRPLKVEPWKYYFYVEFEGGLDEDKVDSAIKEISQITLSVKIKGSMSKLQYPV